MPKWEKALFGGIGGITPILLTIVLADIQILATHIQAVLEGVPKSIYWTLGYTLKAIGLFIVGAVWALFDRGETSAVKVFQLGLVAPATIMAMVNATNAEHFRGSAQVQTETRLMIVGTANAQTQPEPSPESPSPEPSPESPSPEPPPPEPTPLDSFVDGLLGR